MPTRPEGSARSPWRLHRAHSIDKQLPCLGWCNRCLGFFYNFSLSENNTINSDFCRHSRKLIYIYFCLHMWHISQGMVMKNFLVKFGNTILWRTQPRASNAWSAWHVEMCQGSVTWIVRSLALGQVNPARHLPQPVPWITPMLLVPALLWLDGKLLWKAWRRRSKIWRVWSESLRTS